MRLFAAVVVAVLLAGPGCRRSAPPAEPGAPGQTSLRIATFEPRSLNPAGLVDGPSRVVAENLFEGLVTRDAHGGAIPGAAERWTTSPDGLTWTFTLRDALVWSDGTPLVAEDFVWSLRRAVDPKTANPQAEMLFPVKNAEAVTKGADPATLGVRADGQRTVVLTLERPYPTLPRLLMTGYAAPAPRHVVEAHGPKWTEPAHIAVNGPFKPVLHTPGERLVLEKNPRYHAAAEVALTEVVYRFTDQGQLAWQWYQLGEIDWSEGLLPAEVIEELRRDPSGPLRVDDYEGLFFLMVNTQRAPFDDPRVRRALSLAIDRGRLCRQLLTGGERPAAFAIPPTMTSARPPAGPVFDPGLSQKLLAEAGFGPARPFPAVELIFNTNDKNRRIAEFLQRSLSETLGVRLVLRNMEWRTFLDTLGGPDWQLGQLNMGGFDATDYLTLLVTDGPGNRSRWSNAAFDALYRAVREAPTVEARDLRLRDALALLQEEMPIIPVFQLTRQVLLRPGLRGHEPTPDNIHPLRFMTFQEPKAE